MKVFDTRARSRGSRRLAVVSPDGADLTTRSRQARRARTLAARPLARALGEEAARAVGASRASLYRREKRLERRREGRTGAPADLDQRSHAQDRAAAR